MEVRVRRKDGMALLGHRKLEMLCQNVRPSGVLIGHSQSHKFISSTSGIMFTQITQQGACDGCVGFDRFVPSLGTVGAHVRHASDVLLTFAVVGDVAAFVVRRAILKH